MENSAKTDLRVIKTKRAIRRAFAELLTRKPMDEITVSDVAKEALINRKTFYSHYIGVHEIIAEIEDEFTASLQTLLAQKQFEDILTDPSAFFYDVMQIINRDIDVYGRLLTVNGKSSLVQKIIRMCRQQICAALEQEAPVNYEMLDLAVHFMLSGLLAVFTDWYSSGRQESLEDLSARLSCLCFDGVNGFMREAGRQLTGNSFV